MVMTSKLSLQFLFSLLLIGVFVSTAQAETIIGRWCDRPLASMPELNSIKEIVLTDDGDIELRSRYGDGSSGVEKLAEKSGQLYVALNNAHGEKFRIVPADGNLQLLDDDGVFRVATRLENKPQPGECGM